IPANVAAALVRPKDQRAATERVAIEAQFENSRIEKLTKLKQSIATHKAKRPQLPDEAKAQSVAELAQPRVTKVLLRGDFLAPGDVVAAGSLSVLPQFSPRDASPNRRDLAKWLVDPANPLTPRVAVNRVWHQLFGRGIVPTLDDFGKQGEKPSHPEL